MPGVISSELITMVQSIVFLVLFEGWCCDHWNTVDPFHFLIGHSKPKLTMKAPSTILAIASLAVSVNAHGYISKPKATYEPNTIYTAYNALTTASINQAFAGGKFDGSPADNTKIFTERWNATGYKSLREMVDPIAPDYGKSVKTATPVDVTGYTEMWWQNDEYKEGFIASHEGPCEAWIDDVRIFHHDDCAAQFKTYPAKVPADYSSCKGDCLFSFYWSALHEPNWQIYKQCVPITNNSSGTPTQSSGSDEAVTPKPTTTTPTVTTAPVATEAPVAQTSTPAPEVTTASPVATKAPVAPTSTPAPDATDATPTATEGAAGSSSTPAPEATYETPEAPEATPATPPSNDNCAM
ncbi:hypothetical protein PHMEG_00010684 [Phytophthora megakarya]|uniref:Uncharacterized protein n=1 Tax=Phytophthora megakarya TaxID=4795 RepID=A0A225WDG1_9STRA|nr:hypothetical protein PHMEG_00010684 [Phytophthora megakarya]